MRRVASFPLARLPRPLVAALAGGVIVTAAWVVVDASAPSPSRSRGGTPIGSPVAVDRPAPTLPEPLLSGRRFVGVGELRGSVVVVNFWASWCHACKTETPELEALARTYRGRGVRFLGVDYEDRRTAALAFERAFGSDYPSVSDPDGTLADAYGIVGLPTTYVIGPDGRIRYAVTGKVDVPSLRRAIDAVAAEGISKG